MVPIPSYVIHPHIIKAMCAPWPEFKQKGVHFSPGRLQIKTFVHTHFLPTHVTKFNSTPVLIYRFLSVQIILRTTYMWNFSSYVFFSEMFILTQYKVKTHYILHIYRIGCAFCLLLLQNQVSEYPSSTTKMASHFDFGFIHQRLKTLYTVVNECLIWFAVCDPMIPAQNNFRIVTDLVFLMPLLNLHIDF